MCVRAEWKAILWDYFSAGGGQIRWDRVQGEYKWTTKSAQYRDPHRNGSQGQHTAAIAIPSHRFWAERQTMLRTENIWMTTSPQQQNLINSKRIEMAS